jgi:hypothetical protein
LAATAALAICAAGLAGPPTPAAASPAAATPAGAPAAVAPAAANRAAVNLATVNLAAATSCYIVCDDVNPNTAMYENSNGALVPCNGYRTVYAIGTSVELRYSTSCRMAWARGDGYFPIKIESFNANGSFRTSRERVSCPTCGQIWTVALNDAGLTARACAYGPSTGWVCTARY